MTIRYQCLDNKICVIIVFFQSYNSINSCDISTLLSVNLIIAAKFYVNFMSSRPFQFFQVLVIQSYMDADFNKNQNFIFHFNDDIYCEIHVLQYRVFIVNK